MPAIANSIENDQNEDNYDDGTTLALWFIAMLGVASLLSNFVILKFYMPEVGCFCFKLLPLNISHVLLLTLVGKTR